MQHKWWGIHQIRYVEDLLPYDLLATDQAQADTIRDHLIRVGVDRYVGYVTTLDGFDLTRSQQVAPADLDTVPDAFILDVRARSEFDGGHIPGATNISAGRLLRDQDQIPAGRPIVSYCQSGARNIVAAQALRRAGFDVRELDGSYLGWLRSEQPTETLV